MNVNPAGNTGPMSDIQAPSQAPRQRVQTDHASFSEFDALTRSLQNTPDLRETEVLRAKGLVDDPKYPPAEAVRRLANLFAIHLDQQ